MGFSNSRMPEKSSQVTRQSRVIWREFSGMSDIEKPILAPLTHSSDGIRIVSDPEKIRIIHYFRIIHYPDNYALNPDIRNIMLFRSSYSGLLENKP